MAGTSNRNDESISELRKYGVVMAVAFVALGVLLLLKGKDQYLIFFALASLFLAAGLAVPFILKPIYCLWIAMAHAMGWIMTRIILTITYVILLAPLGLLLRFFGKDLLDVKFDPSVSGSYWNEREPAGPGERDYERQF
jgi:hypothetical protein